MSVCKQLIDRANENGGPDNITVIAARFDGEGLSARRRDAVGHARSVTGYWPSTAASRPTYVCVGDGIGGRTGGASSGAGARQASDAESALRAMQLPAE